MTISRYRNAATATAFASLALLPLSGNAVADDASACDQVEYAMGLRYQQQSAEITALQRQGFELATYRLEKQIEAHGEGADLAIITDVDETLIDNSALLVRDMQACHDFTTWDTWLHWEREGEPRLIPGAKDFLEFADEQGVSIYYVSDRYQENKADTLATMEALELPQVSDERVMLLGPPKTERRAIVEDSHTLVMQLGDTLHDFSGDFVDASLEEQRDLVNDHAERFGQDWIVFPNASYGSWSDAELNAWEAPFESE
ncbi:MAG: 5'-nucleotidase, lipoprotein e(P4) family [Vreelandella alkaliphila]|uniref:5'-nucleotidase n=1 Tax=Halomonas campaniensis TaxID=213554 RepID=A0A3D0KGW4_9GAMM|nr:MULTISPECIES: HAD family acid phosphatase [unclassified Halomonas]HBP42896.1 5'-nucleotidase [Halomonas sp.]HBS82188.1 5'-nucleotidase [Halomonas campaniensis]ASK19766.1 5'-nucleotidase [Halomonas sp. N3-2A]UTD53719.1 5'-nucleotidase [Halomonas sp. MS1]HCA02530.1 5'-nucleotidase [Halomonas campaniensis]